MFTSNRLRHVTLAEITIKIKAPGTWDDDKCGVLYSYTTERIKQIAAYAKSISLDSPELIMEFESSELPASMTIKGKQ